MFLDRQLPDLGLVERLADRRIRLVDRLLARHDFDRLGHEPNLEYEVEGDRRVDLHDDDSLHDRLEARGLGAQLVGTGRNLGELEGTVLRSGDRAYRVRACVDERDRRL